MNRLTKPDRPEFLMDLGRYIWRQQRSGVCLEAIACRWGVSPELLRLAVAFKQAPDWVKLRAMVEDWSLDRIACAVRGLDMALALRGAEANSRGSRAG